MTDIRGNYVKDKKPETFYKEKERPGLKEAERGFSSKLLHQREMFMLSDELAERKHAEQERLE